MTQLPFPDGKKFAFTVIDDTDVATLKNVGPVYDLLTELGFRTTKTVWPLACPEGSPNFSSSETLEDPAYLAFVQELARRGFEITWHGATMESSKRERTLLALERFNAALGHYPRVHANHSYNRENVYWAEQRIDSTLLQSIVQRQSPFPRGYYQGHVEGSPWYWGDVCAREIRYTRNLTFNRINLRRINPSMPYHDARRPLVARWFSASDAEDCVAFNRLLRSENQRRLESENGVCIVATHFGKRFAENGKVNAETERLLRELSGRDGWFVPVGQMLDWLDAQRPGAVEIGRVEWLRMQWTWALDIFRRKLARRL